jgi:hypothetical protein
MLWQMKREVIKLFVNKEVAIIKLEKILKQLKKHR